MAKAVIIEVQDASGVAKWVGRNTGEVNLPVDVVSSIPGTGATSLGKAEDAAHVSGDTGVAAWGVVNASAATTFAADGDYAPLAVTTKGQLQTTAGNSLSTDASALNTVLTIDSGGTGRLLASSSWSYNGATWDRHRNNMDATLLASAARTITTASADQTNYNGRGVHVVLDMTVVGTGSVTLTIQGKDALSGAYYTILAGLAVTTNSTNVYRVFPGSTVTANVAANDIVPRTWRVNVVANNANSATYSVGVSVIQ